MRLGVDGKKIPEAAMRGPIASFDHGRELGMDGLFFRSVLDMSPTLDRGFLREIRRHADTLDMYLETGLGKVNPYATPEAPELRAIGDGSIVLGFRRMMEACADIDCRELWVATANFKPQFAGRHACDRFREDVTWSEQLAATERFLKILAPIARDLGIHMNIETHEEITTFEVVRLVEAVGPDVVGIVFDTGNVLQRCEHPTYAARRVAPYVRQTHVKDAYLGYCDTGLEYQLRPCGLGAVDFAGIMEVLAAANPDLNLSIENNESYTDRPRPIDRKRIDIFDPVWRAGHPDLDVDEFAAYVELAQTYARRIAAGEVPDLATYSRIPFGFDEAVDYILVSAAHIRAICAERDIPIRAPAAGAA